MKVIAYIAALLSICLPLKISAQGWQKNWSAGAYFQASSTESMPFWAVTGRDGVVPSTTSGLLTVEGDAGYVFENDFFLEAGTRLVCGVAAEKEGGSRAFGLVDRLYATGGWKMFHLDLGMKPREKEFGDLSVTGGNMMWTGNARNIPGINLRTDWIYLNKGHHVAIRGNYAHYQMIDNRYVQKTMLHDKSFELKVSPIRRLDFSVGLEHIAQWGGICPVYGQQPTSFGDYLKIVMAKSGDDDATVSDQVNVLGNHLGRQFMRIDWHADDFDLTMQYDKPFEDGSGVKLKNIPDGVWTLKLSLNDREAFVTDIIGEIISTTWQSGPEHDRPATEEEMKHQNPSSIFYGKIVLGGRDNYFNHSMYRSGWTNHGRVIGLPLINGLIYDGKGAVKGLECTRIRAFHMGLGGNIVSGLPYKLKVTYSRNYGKYKQAETSFYNTTPWQLSMGLEVLLKKSLTRIPTDISVGTYYDVGQLYDDSFGVTLKLSY